MTDKELTVWLGDYSINLGGYEGTELPMENCD